MFGKDKKKLASLIVGVGTKPEGESETDSSMDVGSEALKEAASDVMSALKKNDASAFASSLKEFFYLCKDEGSESEGGDSYEEEDEI